MPAEPSNRHPLTTAVSMLLVVLDEVVEWMDWMNVDGLRAPSPAAFVGGIHEMPAGYTAFFTVDLEPGRYAWIAESGAELGMVNEFTIE